MLRKLFFFLFKKSKGPFYTITYSDVTMETSLDFTDIKIVTSV